jgi:hypothetical protein
MIRSTVHNLFCRMRQHKILHLFSAFTDQTEAQSWSEHAPMNWVAYAEEAELLPLAMRRQIISLGCSNSCTSLTLRQRITNWRTSFGEEMRCRLRIQFLPWSAFATVKFLRQVNLSREGANSTGVELWNHRSCLNCMLWPLPNLIDVHTLNSCCFVGDSDAGCATHGLDDCFHRSHCHNRRARLNLSRSRMPRPPIDIGHWTHFQLTKQWPRLVSSAPHHKKFLLIRSIRLIAHLDKGNTIMW